MNFINLTIKHLIIRPISCSFVTGFCLGCLPNNVYINFENKRYKLLPIPLMSGMVCSFGLMVSPALILNYCFNATYFDRLIDKYNINIERFHQYDDKNNKYAYPSLLLLNINKKKIEDNKI